MIDVMSSFSNIMFVLFFKEKSVLLCFVLFSFFAFPEFATLRSIVLRYACASTATRVSSFFLFFLFFFFSLEVSLFPSIFVPLPFSLCMECVCVFIKMHMCVCVCVYLLNCTNYCESIYQGCFH